MFRFPGLRSAPVSGQLDAIRHGAGPLGRPPAALIELLARFTGEPLPRCRRMARRWLLHTLQVRRSWHYLAALDEAAFARRLAAVTFDDEALVAHYLDSRPAGVVVAMPHMGDYLATLGRLGRALRRRREVWIPRDQAWSEAEARLFARFDTPFLHHRVIRHHPRAGLQALQALRRGQILLTFFDLGRHWGATTEVQWLGAPMHLVRGPAELAWHSGSELLPIFSRQTDRGRAFVQVAQALSPRDFRESGPGAAVQAMTQRLADLASAAIRARPELWHHWLLIPHLMDPTNHPLDRAALGPDREPG